METTWVGLEKLYCHGSQFYPSHAFSLNHWRFNFDEIFGHIFLFLFFFSFVLSSVMAAELLSEYRFMPNTFALPREAL